MLLILWAALFIAPPSLFLDLPGLDDRPTGPCAFPFIYQGESYSTCKTDKKGGKLWCSLTSNYDEDRQWRYCDPSEHRPCTFPFIFENNAYFACTREGAGDNALWCATTDDYDRDTKWKVCALEGRRS
uniref:Fibronectin type-II domain-containing protein n=1 Tax=Varanus komodoensis TaxID=61221 RepID=A0A8D2J377_VARKO